MRDRSTDNFGSYRQILLLSGPLILSQTSVMLMQVVDGLFLARYSETAIAAVGPAGMSFWSVLGLFSGLCGYTATFVAQYVGAKRSERVGAAVWQGIYMALGAGTIIASLSFLARPLFAWMGHDPAVMAQEITYFRILSWGGVLYLLSAAISGFFAGRHDTVTLMLIHLLGVGINAVLAWAMIFGRWGFPEMGIAGAGWATIIAHAVDVILLGAIFLRAKYRRDFGTWKDRPLDRALLLRLVRYGFPNGVRLVVEIIAWTIFLAFVGRVDALGLAASNIVWRINGMAFFPLIGMSIALAMLVGQAQGAGRPERSELVAWRGLAMGEVWMVLAAAVFVLAPGMLVGPFLDQARLGHEEYFALRGTCIVLLRFVAAYCLLDALNIVFMAALQGAGDTRWSLIASAVMHVMYILALWTIDRLGGGLYVMWSTATIFVMAMSFVWLVRFWSGRWQSMRVIEHAPPELESPTEAEHGSAQL
ncbi:MAG: MATE family efflux transporter [Phycisphaeraceae bacterium]|nr:MATE family efflux transporter [Phycisphaeraceae bacterium]